MHGRTLPPPGRADSGARAYLLLVTWRSTSAVLLLAAGLSGCDAFRVHPYAVPQDEWLQDLTEKNLAKIARIVPPETFTFAAFGDSQRWEDEASYAVPSINADPDLLFAIHVGDIVEFGLGQEYVWLNEYYRDLKIPFVTVVGNHDLLGNGGTIYESVYGPRNYTFLFGRLKFVMLDSNSREYVDEIVPDLAWLERELVPEPTWDRAIVVSHVPFDDNDFRRELEEPYKEIVQRHGNVILSLHGHDHEFRDEMVEELRTVQTDKMENRNWTKITVGPEGVIEVRQVFF